MLDRRIFCTTAFVFGAAIIGLSSAQAEAAPGLVNKANPPIAAAASLRYALDEVAKAYHARSGQAVRISYAASGNLVQQIEAGAPFQLFLSADAAHVQRLAAKGLLQGVGENYAVGRLALVVPANSQIRLDPQLKGLGRALALGQVKRLAIANPVTAPYGTQAKLALQKAGFWTVAEPHLVTGENVGQAFQFLASGGAQAGLVSLSLVKTAGFKGRYVVVDHGLHQPLVQRMALIKGAGAQARAFYRFLLSAEGQTVLARHGYDQPARKISPKRVG